MEFRFLFHLPVLKIWFWYTPGGIKGTGLCDGALVHMDDIPGSKRFLETSYPDVFSWASPPSCQDNSGVASHFRPWLLTFGPSTSLLAYFPYFQKKRKKRREKGL
jgi:hypothetical protein